MHKLVIKKVHSTQDAYNEHLKEGLRKKYTKKKHCNTQ